MENKDSAEKIAAEELPDDWWYRVYVAVLISNVLVISALYAFTVYFS